MRHFNEISLDNFQSETKGSHRIRTFMRTDVVKTDD